MKWSSEKPPVPGIYLVSRPVPGGMRGQYMLRLEQAEIDHGNYSGYLWYGPIPEPKEPQQ